MNLGDKNLPRAVKAVLKYRLPSRFEDRSDERVHAAVLVPLFLAEGEYRLLFIQRTDRVEYHKNQISFPGGMVEESDPSHQGTALREAEEEVGIRRDHVEVLGRLDDAATVSTRFIIHPFVGLIPYPYEFVLNKAEVGRVIQVPLEFFFRKDSRTARADVGGRIYDTSAYQYKDDLIWGATARIVDNFVEIVGPKLGLPRH